MDLLLPCPYGGSLTWSINHCSFQQICSELLILVDLVRLVPLALKSDNIYGVERGLIYSEITKTLIDVYECDVLRVS